MLAWLDWALRVFYAAGNVSTLGHGNVSSVRPKTFADLERNTGTPRAHRAPTASPFSSPRPAGRTWRARPFWCAARSFFFSKENLVNAVCVSLCGLRYTPEILGYVRTLGPSALAQIVSCAFRKKKSSSHVPNAWGRTSHRSLMCRTPGGWAPKKTYHVHSARRSISWIALYVSTCAVRPDVTFCSPYVRAGMNGTP